MRVSDSAESISRLDAIQRIAEEKEERDVCPECETEFDDVDMTHGGELVFFHDGEQCGHDLEEVSAVEL